MMDRDYSRFLTKGVPLFIKWEHPFVETYP